MNSTNGSNTEPKKIAVIGAGIGGLAAAAILARQGHSVSVFEKNATPGGKMSEVSVQGYRFDTGPSLLTMPHILDQLFSFCGEKTADWLELTSVEPVCRYHFSDGTRFDSYEDPGKALSEIRRIAPEDSENYQDFLHYSEGLYNLTSGTFLYHPLQTWSDLLRLPLSDFFKIDAFSTVSKSVDKRIKSVYLRQFFKRFATYNGSSPYRAPATLNVIPYVELVMGGYYVKGGLFQIASALEKLALKMGAEVHYKQDVEQILLEGKSVKGILINGKEHPFDLIVSNSDARETYVNLLPDAIIPRSRKNKIDRVEPSCSGYVLLLGTRKKWDKLAHHTIFFSSDYNQEFEDIFKNRKLPSDPTIYVANTSHSDPDHAPDGGSNLFVLVNAPYTGAEHRSESQDLRYADFIVAELERRGLGGLKNAMVTRQIITPADFESRYRSNRGSIYGTSSNSRFAAFMRPRNRSPYVEGLWLVGGSTHPGGGIPLCILSAFHACGVPVKA